MRLGGPAERKARHRVKLELPVRELDQHVAGAHAIFRRRRHEILKSRTGQHERTVIGQRANIERRHQSTRPAIEREQAAPLQNGQAFLESLQANGVVDDIDAAFDCPVGLRCTHRRAIWDYHPNVRSDFRIQIKGSQPPIPAYA